MERKHFFKESKEGIQYSKGVKIVTNKSPLVQE
jgi:hypothetical protein